MVPPGLPYLRGRVSHPAHTIPSGRDPCSTVGRVPTVRLPQNPAGLTPLKPHHLDAGRRLAYTARAMYLAQPYFWFTNGMTELPRA